MTRQPMKNASIPPIQASVKYEKFQIFKKNFNNFLAYLLKEEF